MNGQQGKIIESGRVLMADIRNGHRCTDGFFFICHKGSSHDPDSYRDTKKNLGAS